MQNRRICQCRPLLVMKVLHTLQQGQGEARPIQYYNNFVGYIYIYMHTVQPEKQVRLPGQNPEAKCAKAGIADRMRF